MHDHELANRFKYHPANTEERKNAHEAIRGRCLSLAERIVDLVPEGREKSLAITNLEQVMFWANAGIARQPDE